MQTILIIDYGSQYTQLIARRARELGFYSIICSAEIKLNEIQNRAPSAIVLSGGPNSVYEEGSPQLPQGFLNWQKEVKVPVLGICYGLQLLMKDLGGSVEPGKTREYGKGKVSWSHSKLGTGTQVMWMSHGDHVSKVAPGFKVTAESDSGIVAAVENELDKIFAFQFHPEVTHSERGDELLKKFFIEMAGLKSNWNAQSMYAAIEEKVKSQVGPEDHVLCALSGGVDSTVAAKTIHKILSQTPGGGSRLHCVFVDHGLLRFQEQARVMKLFIDQLHLSVQCVDASQEFLSALKGVSDPEQKRKIIGKEFIEVFKRAATELEKQLGKKPKFLLQGTLYPDVIESSPAQHDQSGGKKHSVTIKSHHNVGGLPKELGFELLEPFRDLFKDEVRMIGRSIGVPESFIERHPFPGPGLAVRIIGEITPERVEILQKVDEIFIQALRDEGLYHKIWQAFAVFLPIRTVGVQGDGRTHDYVVALRAVTSVDGMTADWFHFDSHFLAKVSTKICNEVKGVSRVVYDISSKPPATIEWE